MQLLPFTVAYTHRIVHVGLTLSGTHIRPSFFYGFPSSMGPRYHVLIRHPKARDIRFSFFPSPFLSKGEEAQRKARMETFFFRGPSKTKRNETHSFIRSLVSTAIFLSFVSINRVLSSVAAARGNPRLLSFPLIPPPPRPLFLLLHHHHPSPRWIYRWKPEAAIN